LAYSIFRRSIFALSCIGIVNAAAGCEDIDEFTYQVEGNNGGENTWKQTQ